MYQLIVVAGKNRGSVFPVQPGENWIGRQEGNAVVINSSRVSKRHCLIYLGSDGRLEVRDNGSVNGTLVNGMPVQRKRLRPGDRVSVGDFVLQLVAPSKSKSRPAPPAILESGRGGQVIAGNFGGGAGFDQGQGGFPAVAGNLALQPLGMVGTNLDAGLAPAPVGPQVPKFNVDPKAWLLYHFEKYLMPFFYSMLLKQEWRAIAVTVVSGFVIINLLLSVQPILDQGRELVVREIKQRASFMAKEIADRNTAPLSAHAETKTEIGPPETAYGVRVAMLTDMDLRIISPATKLNQYLTYGTEAQFALRVRDLFRAGDQLGRVAEVDDSTVVAVEPVMILSPQAGRNIPVGMAVVSIDTQLSTPTFGDMGVVYSETLILTGLVAALMLLILYRLSLKPFEVLADDLDRALKGDLPQVTHEFKLSELDGLWDMVNSAVQRIPKSASGDPLAAPGEAGVPVDDCLAAFRILTGMAGAVVALCGADQKILDVNEAFEAVTGLRKDAALGQDIPSIARDQAFGALVTDLFARVQPGGEPALDDFEFSGVAYKIHATALGSAGGPAKAYIFLALKAEAT